jgi:hypothetical protein
VNIDFHYGVIYILAKSAGLSEDESEVIAHACQYVDDSVVKDELIFAQGQRFERYASAHKIVDIRNCDSEKNREAWIPFHFVPSGKGADFSEKLICQSDSQVIRQVVTEALQHRKDDNGLHRLGVTLHAYVDTWAHKGFCGDVNEVNKVTELSYIQPNEKLSQLIANGFKSFFDKLESDTLDDFLPLGHGAALTLPDQPWVEWSYKDSAGQKVTRHNLPDFLEAADKAYRILVAYQKNETSFADQDGLPKSLKNALKKQLFSCQDEDAKIRLENLQVAVQKGFFENVTSIPEYVGKGEKSWKHMATGIISDQDDLLPSRDKPDWSAKQFELSNYRKFHDAVKQHRQYLLDVVLPKFDLRIA